MNKFKLSLGPWVFNPSLASTVVTLLLLPLLVYLGFWQLERKETKIKLYAELESRTKEPVLKIEQIPQNPSSIQSIRFKKLQVTGKFLNTNQLLLDNQIFQSRAGYHVITPFYIEDSNKILLINRGWIPIGEDRSEIPKINPIEGIITLIGIITEPSHLLVLKETVFEENLSFPLVLQTLDFTKLSKILNQPLFPFLLQLQTGAPYGYTVSPITLGTSANRHLGYAIQWFTMAIITLLYYLVINTSRRS